MWGWVVGGTAVVAGIVGIAMYFDAKAAIPSADEIQNLESALPEGCVVHDVGSYGKIDNLIIVECENRKVTSTYGYMRQQHGKTSEVDRSAAFVISAG